jgi:hypothetical protein
MPVMTRRMYKEYCSNDCYNTIDKRFMVQAQERAEFKTRIGKNRYKAIRKPLINALRPLSWYKNIYEEIQPPLQLTW